jgi:2-amino-4-hydroxy-6-hydroxymethyldihydropteridine diphosphokinase
MHTVNIGIGTNIEPRRERMRKAISALEEFGEVEKQSSIYETPPFGFTDQSNFLNAVVLLRTGLELTQLHTSLKQLERKLGRVDRLRWHEREIDFDILFFDDVITASKELTVPHSELQNRAFVLIPLAEIAPDVFHPVLKKDIAELLKELDYEKDSIHPIEA